MQYIYDQSVNIQEENLELRKSLKDLLRRTRLLNVVKERLEAEQLQLINRLKLAVDLKRIRLSNLSVQSNCQALVKYHGDQQD